MSSFGLIPSAYAQAAGSGGADTGQMLQQFAPIILIVIIFYFLLIRPQQQRAKQLKQQLTALKRGDAVVTAGGIIGTVSRVVSDDELIIEIADNVRVRVVRSTITGVTGRGEPRTDTKPEPTEKADAASTPKLFRRGRAPAEGKPQG
jgi:preprotein translocase subunit YajC